MPALLTRISMRPNRSRAALVISSVAESLVRSVGEQIVCLVLLTRTRGERFQRLTVAIDAGDSDARGQQPTRYRPTDTARGASYDCHSLGFGHAALLLS